MCYIIYIYIYITINVRLYEKSCEIFICKPYYICRLVLKNLDFSGGSDGKVSVYNVGDQGSIPGSGRSLEKEMAIHSSTIAWKVPWMEEPGRLQSMGSQTVGHD